MITAQVLVLYFLPGCGVAAALYLSERRYGRAERFYVALSAILFWPIYLPGLLSRQIPGTGVSHASMRRTKDSLDAAIDQVDADLSRALASLEGLANAALSLETQRIPELRHAWTSLADRIREMDRVLSSPGGPTPIDALVEAPGEEMSPAALDRLRHSMEIRKQNLNRLRNVRRRAYEDLMGTLAWVRELISMIHLARFTGAPAARVQELVGQIASAVEALSEASLEEGPDDEQKPSSGPISVPSRVKLTSASSACPREMSPTPGF